MGRMGLALAGVTMPIIIIVAGGAVIMELIEEQAGFLIPLCFINQPIESGLKE
jgi:hypothetical protein